MYIYINSHYVKDIEATISPFDHGFLYGLGVFETFRVYKGFPFLLEDHLKRLQSAVDELGIHYQINFDEIMEILQKLLKLNQCHDEDVTVRLNISAGNGEVGKLLQTYDKPNLLCFLRKAPPLNNDEKDVVLLEIPRNTPEGTFRLKSHHYLNNILGKREIREAPEKEGLFLTANGFVAEGIVSNVFWVKNNSVYTPAVETGILNGITRQFIIKCLENLDIDVSEGFYTKKQMFEAEEVILTNSSQEIIAVKKVDDHIFDGNEGTIVKKLRDLYDHYRKTLLSKDEL
ncbi:aminodeoxychorismate lyase [Metabacillus litoralis]|uniref:Aminodeoxychorismate lyase n=1 Tax=Metabacillus litoralis TaxID=152268 RepID=A0A5C6VK73_9BACI|nr:aminodeoxychorismate lyase [Metabacillus litoralis]TXC85031.1 aminodeoxychorismate lyase [Metabacillus litoralis]